MLPRNVRNFWVEAEIDGKKERISFATRNASGCISMTIKVRENGGISDKQVWVGCVADVFGNLTVTASRSDKAKRTVLLKTRR